MKFAKRIASEPWFLGLRWLLVLPAAVLGFYTALHLSMALLAMQSSICPPSDLPTSPICRMPGIELAPFGFGLIAAPIFVVLFGTLMAPSRRAIVAWVIFALGLCAALAMSWKTAFLVIPVGIVGALTARVLQSRSGERSGA